MDLRKSVASFLGLGKESAPPIEEPVADAPVIETAKPSSGTLAIDAPRSGETPPRYRVDIYPIKEKTMPPKEPIQPLAVYPKPAPRPQNVLVNGRPIGFDASAPLTEKGLRNLKLFPEKERIFLKSNNQVRHFHSGEALDLSYFPDLEIFTRE